MAPWKSTGGNPLSKDRLDLARGGTNRHIKRHRAATRVRFEERTNHLKCDDAHTYHGKGPDVLKYTWLKILDTPRKRGTRMTAGELKAELDSRGFFVS